MSIDVADRSSNKPEQIVHAAETIGRSKHRREVFAAIYRGKRRAKTVQELIEATKLPHIRVLDAGKHLADHSIVKQVRVDGQTAYEKIDFFQRNRRKILRLAADPAAREKVATKRGAATSLRNGSAKGLLVNFSVRLRKPLATYVTVDDIDSFSKVRGVDALPQYERMPETTFKNGVARVLHRKGTFKDWGGEQRDLFDTNLRIRGKRQRAAFAFKGPGMTGRLTPGKMGKNGDQIQRLLRCPADVFIVQYWAQIDDSVLEQLGQLAQLKSYFESRKLWFGIIDGDDSTRLMQAYPTAFGKAND
ncbi:MAG TPA: hypothetical protein VJP77_02490 [Planctomycetota bacterium]|nr:hypothetical protein [Planctomycetota bacterium]